VTLEDPLFPGLSIDSETMLRLAMHGARLGTWARDLATDRIYRP
jgi:hypothetical protein